MKNSQTLLPRRGCERQFHVKAELSKAARQKVVLVHQQDLFQAKPSKQIKVLRWDAHPFLKKQKETGYDEDCRPFGWPRKLSAADERHINLITLWYWRMSNKSELAETRYIHLLSREVWPNGIIMGKLQPKSRTSDVKNQTKQLNYAVKLESSGLMSQMVIVEERKFVH